jgi:RimJ/RimL family protein N-acetyltransferase
MALIKKLAASVYCRGNHPPGRRGKNLALRDMEVFSPHISFYLRTERLVLRQLVPSDIPALKEWMPDKKTDIKC